MAGIKISQLPAYPAPLAPGDLIPIVSNGSGILTTYHVSASNFIVPPVIDIASVMTVPYTSLASVTISNPSLARYSLSFSVPQGPPGTNGVAGSIVQVSAVSSTTVSVSNVGTPQQASLLFKIPPGSTGPQGIQGLRGLQGDWSSPQTIKYLTGSGYMPTSADAGSLLIIESNTPATTLFVLSAPVSSVGNFIVGQKVDFVRTGTAPVSCTSVFNSTINGTPSLVLRDQYSSASLIYYKPNQWLVIGDLATL